MGSILAILGEVIAYLPQAVKLGMDVSSIVQRALAITSGPADPTPEQIAELRTELDAEMAKLQALTAQLDQDPPAGG